MHFQILGRSVGKEKKYVQKKKEKEVWNYEA